MPPLWSHTENHTPKAKTKCFKSKLEDLPNPKRVWTRADWFKSSKKNQQNHVVLELCVMSVAHLVSILIGFHIGYTTRVPNLSLNMYPFSISIDEHVLIKFPMTKSLSKILKFCWILNRTFRILKMSCLFNLLQMYNKYTLQTGKYAPGGTCMPSWEPLLYTISVEGQKFLWWHKLKPFEVLSIIATLRSQILCLLNCKNDMWTEITNPCRFRSHNC